MRVLRRQILSHIERRGGQAHMIPLFTRRTLSALTIISCAFFGLTPTQAQAQEREPAMVAPGSDAIKDGDIAAGTSEDSIRACMARIPKDASIGQVMIAEQSCWRDENDRKPIQAIPGARSTSLTGPGSVAMANDGRQ